MNILKNIYFTSILSKEAMGGCALPKGGTKARTLKARIQETGYICREKDNRKFRCESGGKALTTAVQQTPKWSPDRSQKTGAPEREKEHS